ncbi:MAG: hypothetical protein E7490_05310 [Ruminococcaceae bacterium]|nr:hypothetical protein [Oscillospiraceae bacterium]
MKKRIAMVVLTIAAVLSLTACGEANCKHDGCDKEIAENGYCAEHAIEHALQDALGGLLG